MDKANDIYDEMDWIKRRINELEGKTGTGYYDNRDAIRDSTLTGEERQELEQLYQRFEQLKKEDDKSLGLA